MPLLDYSLYSKILNNNLSKNELDSLIQYIYVISLSFLKNKWKEESFLSLKETELEVMAIENTANLLKTDNRNQIYLAKYLNKYDSEIKTENDFNYWVFKIVKKKPTYSRLSHNNNRNSKLMDL